jgi:ADP-heptose:LPS heptosyltransferase
MTNLVTPRQIVFLSVNLLGDCLCTTPTVRAFRRKYPHALITYIAQNEEHCRILEGNPDIDRCVFSDELTAHGAQIADKSFLQRTGIEPDESTFVYRFDVRQLHRSRPDVFHDHICRGFGQMMGATVESVRPVVVLDEESRATARSILRKPAIVLGMNTTSPVVGRDHRWVMKDWISAEWLRLVKKLHEGGNYDLLAVGARHEIPLTSRYFRNVYGLPIRVVAALLAEAACVVTVESGLSHLCHAVDAPTVLIFSRDVPLVWSRPEEASRCVVIHDDVRLITCDRVLSAVQAVLSMNPVVQSDTLSVRLNSSSAAK